MTNAVAGGSLKQDSVFDFTLSRGSFEDDLVEPVLHPHLASTKLSHCRREQKMLMLSVASRVSLIWASDFTLTRSPFLRLRDTRAPFCVPGPATNPQLRNPPF